MQSSVASSSTLTCPKPTVCYSQPVTFAFDNSYARLPARFYARVTPAQASAPQLVRVNQELAAALGVDAAWLASAEGVQVLAGNLIPESAEPIALAYAGHQFGNFVPQLGDGRAILLGEVVGADGVRRDIQLKGSGRTPYSRGGDGRAALGPVLREYLVSEAMTALGIPSTRALAAVTTGEHVVRDLYLPGAVLTRVAASHIRVGTFQYFAARQDREAVETLLSYALARHYPAAVGGGEDALALLDNVAERQAYLIARWLGVGFVHGVMNTDNSSISGETIDYGPCAFLDEFDPNKVFSSIDHGGRYAYKNQPRIGQWNLARLAETLLPLVSDDETQAVRVLTERVERFPSLFDQAYGRVLRDKLGLENEEPDDSALSTELLQLMASDAVDHTLTFRKLCDVAADPAAVSQLEALFENPTPLHAWIARWHARLGRQSRSPQDSAAAMRGVNPAFIPRNHRVEEAITAAIDHQDFTPFEALLRATTKPYEDQPELAYLSDPPEPQERVLQTFCGT